MPQRTRKRSVRAPSTTSDATKKNFETRDTLHLRGQSSIVTKRIPSSKPGRTRMVGGLPKPLNVVSACQTLRCAGTAVNKLKSHGPYLMENKARSAMVTKTLVQEHRVASEFLTLRCDKGRLARSKIAPVQMRKKILPVTGRVNRISHAQMLQLFQALMKEPMSFLELRGRFGVSRQTIKTLVMNGQLYEIWGPKAVGVTFIPSDKGRAYFKELEAAAKYEPNARKSVTIRLKQATAL